MAQFRWSAENEVFLAPVDAEHRDLFWFADELQVAVAQGDPDAICDTSTVWRSIWPSTCLMKRK